MRVLIACERSGVVRDAFRKRGHQAYSCDILPSEGNGIYHIWSDVLKHLSGYGIERKPWDLMIAHPPCTHLAVSGAAWFYRKKKEQEEALHFVKLLMSAPVEKIAIENPVSVISTRIRKPDQIIQPYQFGHMEQKKTCLWLKGLPKLNPTMNVYEKMMKLPKSKRERLHYLPPSPERAMLRSTTFKGIAEAMAEQWGAN